MSSENNKFQKVRFRLTGGEEFEAEGTLDFINRQYQAFLSLIGKEKELKNFHRPTFPIKTDKTIPANNSHEPARDPFTIQAALERKSISAESPYLPLCEIWEKIFQKEDEVLFFKKKPRIPATEAALMILGGVESLLKIKEYSALQLSRALHRSGFSITRLDRLLGQEIKIGYISSQGSKRSRLYQLTPQGQARAFVLAEKLLKQ